MSYKMASGRIYVLRSPSTPKVYVGSTTKKITRRFQNHLSDFSRYQRGMCKYKPTFDIIQHEDAVIELLEEISFENRQELLNRERHHLKQFVGHSVNVREPGRSIREWQNDNRDKLRANNRRHYYKHRDDILQKRRDAYEPKVRNTPLKTDLSDHPSYRHYREHKAEILKKSALKRTENTGRSPTKLTIKKHGITVDEIAEALLQFQCKCQSSCESVEPLTLD